MELVIQKILGTFFVVVLILVRTGSILCVGLRFMF